MNELQDILEKVKNDVSEEDYGAAMATVIAGLQEANLNNDQGNVDILLSVVWAIYVTLEVHYASSERKKILVEEGGKIGRKNIFGNEDILKTADSIC